MLHPLLDTKEITKRYNIIEKLDKSNINFTEMAGIEANGGSIESDGPVIVGNNLLINSGYQYGGRLGGNVLLNFEISE